MYDVKKPLPNHAESIAHRPEKPVRGDLISHCIHIRFTFLVCNRGARSAGGPHTEAVCVF